MTTSAAETTQHTRRSRVRFGTFGPLVALVLLMVLGAVLNDHFLTVANLANIVARASFIGIIAIGATFVITSGGIDLSVGSMAALIAGAVIMFINAMGPATGSPLLAVLLGAGLAVVLGAVFGLAHGLLITKGRIEPFIVTLGTLGIFRAYLTYFANGGAITLDNDLSDIYAPVYYASLAGVPIPVWVFLAVALFAVYVKHLAGPWRWVYVVSAIIALWFNVFVLIGQSFQKIPFLQALAPTQSEPPFQIAQLVVLVIFIVATIVALRRFHPAPRPVAAVKAVT